MVSKDDKTQLKTNKQIKKKPTQPGLQQNNSKNINGKNRLTILISMLTLNINIGFFSTNLSLLFSFSFSVMWRGHP